MCEFPFGGELALERIVSLILCSESLIDPNCFSQWLTLPKTPHCSLPSMFIC